MMKLWQRTRAEILAEIDRWFPLGESDGKYPCTDTVHEHMLLFPNKAEIAELLGFPIGSVHTYLYGLAGEGKHSYIVTDVQRHLARDPRDLSKTYGRPNYTVILTFLEELTPESYWCRKGFVSAPHKYEQFGTSSLRERGSEFGPNLEYGWKYELAVRQAIKDGKPVPKKVLDQMENGRWLK